MLLRRSIFCQFSVVIPVIPNFYNLYHIDKIMQRNRKNKARRTYGAAGLLSLSLRNRIFL
jgi:hypothetical protein